MITIPGLPGRWSRTPRGPRRLGRAGERAAARFLRRRGFKIVGRNVRTNVGEIDLLCLDPKREAVVVVEVKTRVLDPARTDRPPPESSITAHKKKKLLQLARAIQRQRRWAGRRVRIDVVAIDWPVRGAPAIRHYQGAVTP